MRRGESRTFNATHTNSADSAVLKLGVSTIAAATTAPATEASKAIPFPQACTGDHRCVTTTTTTASATVTCVAGGIGAGTVGDGLQPLPL